MLEYCWLFTLLLRSARYFPGVEGKWTLLPPILPPSSRFKKFLSIIKIIKVADGYIFNGGKKEPSEKDKGTLALVKMEV